MSPEEKRAAAIALYDRFTHEGMDRRTFMSEMTRIAGSAAESAEKSGCAAANSVRTTSSGASDRIVARSGARNPHASRIAKARMVPAVQKRTERSRLRK